MKNSYVVSFGKIVFTIELQPRQVNGTHSWVNAEMKPLAGKPVLQRTGSNLDVVNISCWLRAGQIPSDHTVKHYYDQLRLMGDMAEVAVLSWGNGETSGKFTLDSFTWNLEDVAPDGTWLALSLNLVLKEVAQ